MQLPLNGIRYVRDYLQSSNKNSGNHWVEIQAFVGGTNVALNKTVTSDQVMTPIGGGNIVNGLTASAAYVTTANYRNSYLQVDFGSVQNVDTIKLWHYWADSRTYNNTHTEVSEDGVNWYNIFDSRVSGTYVEGAAGKSLPITYSPITIGAILGTGRALIVAGGGGGGMDMGGGGGAGGVISNSAINIKEGPNPIIVGNGGIGAPAAGVWGQPASHQYNYPAFNGFNSSALGLTAIGGGAGGSSVASYTPGIRGLAGGSGGGSGGYINVAGTYVGGLGTAGQGNNGGQSTTAYYSGGGGGAGAVGVSGNAQANGGNGIIDAILGISYYWGGGGGGSGYSIGGGNGGLGGGGGGAVLTTTGGAGGLNPGAAGGGGTIASWSNTPGGNAGVNTGGGGGGGSHYNANNKGGNGGSGIVIISYATDGSDGISPDSTGGTKTIVGNQTVHIFYSNGVFTAIKAMQGKGNFFLLF